MSFAPLNRRRAAQLLAAAALAGCGRGERATAPSYFQGRLSDWTQGILIDDPELATASGIAGADLGAPVQERLTERSEAAMQRRRTAALRRLVELRALDQTTLSPAERETAAVATRQFEASAAVAAFDFGAFSALSGGRPYPLDQLNPAFSAVPAFLEARQPLASLDDGEAWLARIAAFSETARDQAAHAQAQAAAGRPAPQNVTLAALRAAETAAATPAEAQALYLGFAARLDALVPPPAPEAGGAASPDQRRAAALKQQALALVRDRALPALQRTAETLRALAAAAPAEPGVWRLSDGEAYYAAVLAYETTTALTPEEVHEIGRQRLATLTSELDASLRRQGLTVGTPAERLAALTADPAYAYPNTDEGRAQLLMETQARIARALEAAPNWFSAMPQAGLEVRRAPPGAEAAGTGGYYSPPGLSGAQPGVYFLNLRNTAELTRIDLPTLDFHEAVPGHHLQKALAQEREAPLLARLMGFNAFSEGWALYAEQLMEEQGAYNADPIGRIGYLRWQAWRAARLVVDTGLHALRWSREQAIAFLMEATGDLRPVIETEVDRYAAMPGQACSYEIGRREIARLRDVARRALGADFTLKAFHDQVLRAGEMPLDLLAARIEAWAASPTQSRS